MKNNTQEKTLAAIRITNPKLATSIEEFQNEVKKCSDDAPEFKELLKLFPGKSFSAVCKNWLKNKNARLTR